MDEFLAFLVNLNDFLYGYILVFLLVFAGVYFSIITRFIQIKSLFKTFYILKIKNTNSISSLESFVLTTAARVGIGNIIGVSIAISTGGAGSVFWMWVVAFFGGATAFCESTLAQVYKVKDSDGFFKGGPAYYIYYGLGFKKLSFLFAIFLIMADLIGFNGVLGYSVASVVFDVLPFFQDVFIFKILVGIFISLFAGLMFLKYGIKLSLYFVPIMSIGYLALALFVLIFNIDRLPSVLNAIFSSAFDFKSIFGGFFGSVVVVGAKRGLFSNEAGMGSAPNAAASADVSHPCEQGFVQSFSVLLDLLICSATGVLVLFSDSFLNGALDDELIKYAMCEYFGEFGFYFINLFIFLFGISSFFGNYYYSLINLKFISNNKISYFIFNILAIACVFIGTQLNLKIVWNTADFLMAIISIINILSLFLLSGVLRKTISSYNNNHTFNPSRIGIKNTFCW